MTDITISSTQPAIELYPVTPSLQLQIAAGARGIPGPPAIFANQDEAEAGADGDVVMSPLGTKQQIDARLASQAEAEARVNNTQLMTPLRVSQEVATFVASESEAGLVELASAAETIQGDDTTRATHPAGVKAAINSAIAEQLAATVIAYGALANGDGHGGGTDNTEAFQDAVDAVHALGGGKIIVPLSGTGFYRLDGQVSFNDNDDNPYSNIEIEIESGVTIDVTNASAESFYGTGIYGTEKNLGVAATNGTSSFTTAAAHAFAIGDNIFFKSSVDAISASPGLAWRLGTPTGVQKVYWGEFSKVATVPTATTFTLGSTAGLLFPDYPLTGTDRPCSTVAKVTFIENIKIHGGKFTRYNPGLVGVGFDIIKFDWSHNCRVYDIDINLGVQTGAGVVFERGLNNRVNVTCRHTPGFTYDGGANFNSVKAISSTGTRVTLFDYDGAQGFDETYTGGTPCINTQVIGGASYRNVQDGMTTHGGSYGLSVDGFKAVGCQETAINIRARFFSIRNCDFSGCGRTSSGAIRLGTYAVDGVIENNTIKEARYGLLRISTITESDTPREMNLMINGNRFHRCTQAIRFATLDDVYESTNSHAVEISNNMFKDCVDYAVNVFPYNNGIACVNNCVLPMTGTAPVAFNYQANAGYPIVMHNRFDNIGASSTGIAVASITDTTTFDATNYPSANPQPRILGNFFVGAVSARYTGPGTTGRTPWNKFVGTEGDVIVSGNMGAPVATLVNNGRARAVIVGSNSERAGFAAGTAASPLSGGVEVDNSDGSLKLRSGGSDSLSVDTSGHLTPAADNTQDIGSASKQPRVVYGVSGTFSGVLSGASIVPSGSSVPTNGMYLSAANTLAWATNSTLRLTLTTSNFSSTVGFAGSNVAAGSVSASAASSTVPTLIPNRGDATTGIGAQASGNISNIVGGVEKGRWTSAGLSVIGGFLNLGAPTTKTIASGVITATSTVTIVDTEASAASDDLDTINGGTDGDVLILRTNSSSRDVTVKDSTGNINTNGDCILGTTAQRIVLMYSGSASQWIELSRSLN